MQLSSILVMFFVYFFVLFLFLTDYKDILEKVNQINISIL